MKLTRMRQLAVFFISLQCLGSVNAWSATQILVIGDSHMMGGLGNAVHAGLKAEYQERVTTVASGGTRPWQWIVDPTDVDIAMATNRRQSVNPGEKNFENRDLPQVVKTKTVPKLPQLLADLEQSGVLVDRVVIEHGTNILGFWKWTPAKWATPAGRAELVGWLTKKISPLLDAVGGRRCAWIGVPRNSKSVVKTQALAVALGEAIAAWGRASGNACVYVDSFQLKDAAGGLLMPKLSLTADGYHFSEADGMKWGAAALQEIRAGW